MSRTEDAHKAQTINCEARKKAARKITRLAAKMFATKKKPETASKKFAISSGIELDEKAFFGGSGHARARRELAGEHHLVHLSRCSVPSKNRSN
jgi:hypothetical protein